MDGQRDSPSCGVCGGLMVLIRGRHPGDYKREVCPTCLADRMDQIRLLADRHYGMAFVSIAEPKSLENG